MGEDTFRTSVPEFTVKQMVILVAIVTFLACMAGWLLLGHPFGIGICLYLMMIFYLGNIKKATYRALVIGSEPALSVMMLVYGCYHLSAYLTKGVPGEMTNAFWATLVSVTTSLMLVQQVQRLPKRWQTPVRHIYPPS